VIPELSGARGARAPAVGRKGTASRSRPNLSGVVPVRDTKDGDGGDDDVQSRELGPPSSSA